MALMSEDKRVFFSGSAIVVNDETADRAEAAAAQAVSVANSLPPISPNTMMVDNAAGTIRQSRTFAQVVASLSSELNKLYPNLPNIYGSQGYLNEQGVNNFAKRSENKLFVVNGTSSAPLNDLSYARGAVFVEQHNSTALNQDRSVWGNPYKMSAITLEHVVHPGAEGEFNGGSARAYSTASPNAGEVRFKQALVGWSSIAQTNTGSGNASWDVWGANFIAAQTSGNSAENVVGIEVDVLNSSPAAGPRVGQPGSTNFTGYWAQSDADNVQSDAAFYASHTSKSQGWRNILLFDGSNHDWLAYLRTTANEPTAQGARIETTWANNQCDILSLFTAGNEQFSVNGDNQNPVIIRSGGSLGSVQRKSFSSLQPTDMVLVHV